MRIAFCFYFSFLLFLNLLQANGENPSIKFNWSAIASMPPAPEGNTQSGVAGPFAGAIDDALIIAGGANFPDGPSWEGGNKVYYKDIYILTKNESENYSWITNKDWQLTENVAYGVSIETEEGLLCVGGMDENKRTDKAFLIKYNDEKETIELEDYPSIPVPVANMNGGKIGNKVYVSASDEESGEKYFWSLDLTNPNKGWESLPIWEGSPRAYAIGVVQNNGETDCFYLLKGRFKGKEDFSTHLTDGFYYNPIKNEWKSIDNDSRSQTIKLSAGTGIAIGANHIFLIGGSNGVIFNDLERMGAEISRMADPVQKDSLTFIRDSILKVHPGFVKDIWAFHTITESWTKVGELPFTSQVTTNALMWDDKIMIPSGEVGPCVRTPEIRGAAVEMNTDFGILNTIIVVLYFLLLVGMGVYFAKNQQSTEDFFKGGKRIPAWAAGLSIVGTQLSAITFMAVPAKTFATDWLYFFLSMTIVMVSPFIVYLFLPFYRRFNLTTAYEYLELRFNLATRLIGSIMYIFLQLGRLGIVLLLPSLALSVVTGIDVSLCIVAMGLLSIGYTVLGGIEAVIWTDVIQVIILLGGAIFSLVLLYFSVDTGNMSTYIENYDKMRIFDFAFDFTEPTLWVVLLGGFATNLIQYGSDQTVIQRYLTTKDEKSAAKSIYIGTWMSIPTTLAFFTLGTLLFVFYKSQPEMLNPALEKTDSIFPWYIVNNLPDGISGLLIAAIFAASMSSLDSSMNSVSTVLTTDFIKRLRPLDSEKAYLRIARIFTVIIGIMGISIAVIMATWGISSLWDQFNLIVGLFAGGLGGIFLLGIFSQKANGLGAMIGLIASGGIQYFFKNYTDVHFLLYAFTGMIAAIIVGYLASLILGQNQSHSLDYTLKALK